MNSLKTHFYNLRLHARFFFFFMIAGILIAFGVINRGSRVLPQENKIIDSQPQPAEVPSPSREIQQAAV